MHDLVHSHWKKEESREVYSSTYIIKIHSGAGTESIGVPAS